MGVKEIFFFFFFSPFCFIGRRQRCEQLLGTMSSAWVLAEGGKKAL